MSKATLSSWATRRPGRIPRSPGVVSRMLATLPWVTVTPFGRARGAGGEQHVAAVVGAYRPVRDGGGQVPARSAAARPSPRRPRAGPRRAAPAPRPGPPRWSAPPGTGRPRRPAATARWARPGRPAGRRPRPPSASPGSPPASGWTGWRRRPRCPRSVRRGRRAGRRAGWPGGPARGSRSVPRGARPRRRPGSVAAQCANAWWMRRSGAGVSGPWPNRWKSRRSRGGSWSSRGPRQPSGAVGRVRVAGSSIVRGCRTDMGCSCSDQPPCAAIRIDVRQCRWEIS